MKAAQAENLYGGRTVCEVQEPHAALQNIGISRL
jgi:hypothetical protein